MSIRRLWMSGLWLDVRYALRALAGSPVFAVVAVVSLAIGIGANTVMFSAARFALLDPLPVDRAGELRIVQWHGPSAIDVSQYNSGGSSDRATNRAVRTNYNHRLARALERESGPDGHLFAFNFLSQITVGLEQGPAAAAGGLLASGQYFAVLRPRLHLGRGLGPADDEASAPNAAVISYAFWRRAFGGDSDIVGKVVPINGTPFTIVGVTAAGFRGLSSGTRFAPLTDVTVPIAKQPVVWTPEGGSLITADNRLWLRLMARVPAGADEQGLRRRLTATLRGEMASAAFMPADARPTLEVELTAGARGLDSIGLAAARPLGILAGVVGVVLVLACVNLAGLALARGSGRQRELAVRRALGAGRGRLMRLLLVESSLIAIAGGAAGLLAALWFFPIAAAMITSGFGAPAVELQIDWRTMAATAGASSLAGILFGLLPAVGLTRADRTTHLRHRTAGASTSRLTIGRALLALQIAISLPLLIGAGLLLGTVHRLSTVDLGFSAEGLVVFRLDPTQGRPGSGATADTQAASAVDVPRFARALLARLEAVPGVASATLLENALVSGWVSGNTITIDGRRQSIYMNGVGPRYFETMQIPLRTGRAPTLADTADTARVAVINETAARQLFGSDSPIGRRFTMARREIEVVGVAADTKYSGLRTDVVPTMFDPFLQRAADGPMHVVVRARGSAAGLEPRLREAVASVNADIPITEMRTQTEQIGLAMGRERLLARLMTVFGAFAVVLACIGLYGATASAVARRTNEIGVRVALGAQRSQVVWLMLRQVLALAAVGLAIGVPAALAAAPLLGTLLYGLAPRDPATIIVASTAMVLVALAAGFVPARRAARLEVLQALRSE